MQPGRKQIAAGYVVYGSSTVLVYSVGNGVHAFTLDPSIGTYILTHENIRMPEQGEYYSFNEAYNDLFPPRYVEFVQKIKSGSLGKFYSSRFIGSLVADFHRTLLRGGIFIYPETKNFPTEDCGFYTKRIRLRFLPNKPAARRATAKRKF